MGFQAWMAAGARLVAASLAALSLAGVAVAASPPTALYADPSQPDISGLWVVTGTFYFAPDRSLPVLLGSYKALYDKRMKAFDAGDPIDDVTADCLPAGVPHLLVVPYPFELMQTPGRVTMLYEYDSVVRRIPLDGRPHVDPAKVAATYYGDPVGHWEGDTLVIETTNIRPDTQVDFSGVPHSDALTITERIRRVDDKTLTDQITLNDPKAYAQPFTVTRTYKLHPKWRISEYECQENNRNRRDDSGHTGLGVPGPSK